jgi:hypothetical protein
LAFTLKAVLLAVAIAPLGCSGRLPFAAFARGGSPTLRDHLTSKKETVAATRRP